MYERQEHTEVGYLWYKESHPVQQCALLFDRDPTVMHFDRFEFIPGEGLLSVLYTYPLITYQNQAEVHLVACIIRGNRFWEQAACHFFLDGLAQFLEIFIGFFE